MDKSDINFIKSIQDIGTSKFTPETYKENIAWKKKYLEGKKNVRIVTTLLTPICDRISTNAGVFILEMDCIQNRIEGIGIIKNFPHRCEDYGVKIYDNDYYTITDLTSYDTIFAIRITIYKAYKSSSNKVYRIPENELAFMVRKEGNYGVISKNDSIILPCNYPYLHKDSDQNFTNRPTQFSTNGHFMVIHSRRPLQS